MKTKAEVVLASDDSIAIILEAKIDEKINRQISSLSQIIRDKQYPGIIEIVPSYHILQVYFEPLTCEYRGLIQWIESVVLSLSESNVVKGRIVKIPVCYDPRLGPDIKAICSQKGFDAQTLIRLHSEAEYVVYMMGFTPGFPYLGGMNPKIAMPRKDTPRLRIPSGSVGIAGSQTGIYPVDSPGGWQIIGKTPLKLFDINAEKAFLLSAGQRVIFKPITYETYLTLGGEVDE